MKPDVTYEPTRRQRVKWALRKFKREHIRDDWVSQVLWAIPICAAFGLIGWLASHGVTCR
jgi:hypothetical protein